MDAPCLPGALQSSTGGEREGGCSSSCNVSFASIGAQREDVVPHMMPGQYMYGTYKIFQWYCGHRKTSDEAVWDA